MINFALIGAGRIGKMHAQYIHSNPKCQLKYVYDINNKFSKEVSDLTGAKIKDSAEDAINSSDIDSVFIASSTDTHTKYIIMSAKAGKSILCEKPVDLDINKINECFEIIKDINVPIQIGFNRRFDNNIKKLMISKKDGAIGDLEMILITSRDIAPSTKEYHKTSGGLFRDCTIHDFDMARFILENDPIIEVSAYASQLFSEDIKSINDHDTAMILMKSQNGVLVHINNSRHSAYGYDQRVEIFGSKGMLISNNKNPTTVEEYNKMGTFMKEPIFDFFIERYEEAYRNQLDEFIYCVENNKKPSVVFKDGQIAIILANAAYKSLESKTSVSVNYE
tara:strand:+ start:1053 stop:2057 length:1005 start_codon:yes stop_codon:yes gene_type:complete